MCQHVETLNKYLASERNVQSIREPVGETNSAGWEGSGGNKHRGLLRTFCAWAPRMTQVPDQFLLLPFFLPRGKFCCTVSTVNYLLGHLPLQECLSWRIQFPMREWHCSLFERGFTIRYYEDSARRILGIIKKWTFNRPRKCNRSLCHAPWFVCLHGQHIVSGKPGFGIWSPAIWTVTQSPGSVTLGRSCNFPERQFPQLQNKSTVSFSEQSCKN